MTMVTDPEQKPMQFPPGPQSNYFVGHLRDMQTDQLGFYRRLHRQYGDSLRFRAIWDQYGYLFFHPDSIDYVLRLNQQNYHKGFGLQRLRGWLGNGLVINEGKSWLRQRRLAQPAFHRQRIAALAPIMTGATERMLERWHTYEQDQRSFDIASEMMQLTFQIVAKALFTTEITSGVANIEKAFSDVLGYLNYSMNHFMLPEFIPTPRNRVYFQAMKALDNVVYAIIRERRQSGEDTGDLLSMFMLARDQDTNESMNDEQLRDEVLTMLFAGHETTANTLSWVWYELAKKPQIEQNVYDEIRSVLGGCVPKLEDVAKLPYTRMVIDETLRLYPPAWGISRKSLAEDEVGGYYLPANSEVILMPYITHRHPEFWDKPEEFDPERFTPARSAGRPSLAYFPFGTGPRMCIGNNFALMEAQLVLATIVQQYRVELATRELVVAEPEVTLRPKQGLPVVLKKRK